MKKSYISPSIKVVKIASTSILAGSDTLGVSNTEITDEGRVGAKRRTVCWGDEGEE